MKKQIPYDTDEHLSDESVITRESYSERIGATPFPMPKPNCGVCYMQHDILSSLQSRRRMIEVHRRIL